MAGPHAGNRNRPAYSGQARFRFPPQIIELFAARKPLEFKPPPKKPKLPPMTGIAAYVSRFGTHPPSSAAPTSKPASTPGPALADATPTGASHDDAAVPGAVAQAAAPSAGTKRDATALNAPGRSAKRARAAAFETPAAARARKRLAGSAAARAAAAAAAAEWDPAGRGAAGRTRDAYNTLFVSGFARETLPARLRAEFENYGPVVAVAVPRDRGGVPRGYAFVEFEHEADLKAAYKEAPARKIDGRRVIVDVERARTVKGWRPNRLDGPHNAARHPRPRPHPPARRLPAAR